MSIAFTRRAVAGGVAASLVSLHAKAAPAPAAAPTPAPAPAAEPRILEARASAQQLAPLPAAASDLSTFEGSAPGPLLRYRQGDELFVRLVNTLDRPLSLHWAGLRGDNAMDGVAPLTQAPVPPGGRFDYRRKLVDAGLYLYRPAIFPDSARLVAHGLKGLLLVEEQTPLDVDADYVLALDAWRLDAKGRPLAADEAVSADGAPAATRLTVDGKPAPATREAEPGARIRLRLANLSASRLMILSFDGAQPFVIAIDGQPCDAFEPVRRTIPVAPGARFDLMFDLPAAENARMRLILHGEDGAEQDLFVIAGKGAPRQGADRKGADRKPIAAAPDNRLLPAEIKLAQSKKVDLVIDREAGGAFTLNGARSKAYDGPPLFRVAKGTPVTLGFVNKTDAILSLRPHGFAVRLLHDLDDGWEPYWRNSVVVPPKKTKHIAFLADSPGKWALHDDFLEHEAAGLATWFEVA